ncbi:SDR family oxidoreductase [Pararobbsia silviterrae]|uniref:SDR family oxidoreductase n=1 Tax=Pararobbsia silviterrae TaxID=1792498 RepID=A0A494Y7S0_9BURK|nr:SDR family oxidoreductase [Pararobbsia silviterrae]RKP58749.1 SDR family oxidoreductase [Pararobbsia silviterrae]
MKPESAQKVWITGASSGLGLALATRYAEQGATLGLIARRGELLEAFRARHPALDIAVYALDVRDHAALADAARDFMVRFGCPDIVIANAGISAGSVTGRGDLDVFREIMDINYLSTIATFEPFIAPMTERRHGMLVGITSVAGVRGMPGAGAYSASKAAATRYLESLRVELRAAGVDVVTIAPGYVRTPMTARNDYPRPFIIEPDVFARRAVRAIARKSRFSVIPWPMAIVSVLLHVLPRWLYDLAFERAPRKKRAAD